MTAPAGMARPAHGCLLAVWIDGVKVGTVTEGEYAQMRLLVRRDPRNAASQARNLIHVVASIAWRMALGVPLALFWILASVAFFAPAEFGRSAEEFAGADVVVCMVQDVLAGASVIAAAGLLASAALDPTKLGVKNQFSAALDQMLRMHCRSSVEGRVSVRRCVAACSDAAVLVL